MIFLRFFLVPLIFSCILAASDDTEFRYSGTYNDIPFDVTILTPNLEVKPQCEYAEELFAEFSSQPTDHHWEGEIPDDESVVLEASTEWAISRKIEAARVFAACNEALDKLHNQYFRSADPNDPELSWALDEFSTLFHHYVESGKVAQFYSGIIRGIERLQDENYGMLDHTMYLKYVDFLLMLERPSELDCYHHRENYRWLQRKSIAFANRGLFEHHLRENPTPENQGFDQVLAWGVKMLEDDYILGTPWEDGAGKNARSLSDHLGAFLEHESADYDASDPEDCMKMRHASRCLSGMEAVIRLYAEEMESTRGELAEETNHTENLSQLEEFPELGEFMTEKAITDRIDVLRFDRSHTPVYNE